MNTLSHHHHPLCATDPGAAEAFQRLAAAGYNRIPVSRQALADLDQGMTPRQVAAKHGVHFQTINKLRRARRDQGG